MQNLTEHANITSPQFSDSFISMEKDLQPLFRKKFLFMSYWNKQMPQNSELATFDNHVKKLEFHATFRQKNVLLSCNPCLFNIALSISPSSALFLTIMLPQQAPTVTVRIHLLWVRFVLTRQYFDSLFHFLWLMAFDFNWFPFQTDNHCSKNTIWKCQFCWNILELLLPP